jgi:hypothetical protein
MQTLLGRAGLQDRVCVAVAKTASGLAVRYTESTMADEPAIRTLIKPFALRFAIEHPASS